MPAKPGGDRTQKRRWSINGDFTTLRPAGVARYAREVTLALDALVAERHPLTANLSIDLIVPRPLASPLPLKAITIKVVREFGYPRLPQFWNQLQLPWHVGGGLLSFCNLAPVAVARQIVCIHDLHTRLMPESYGRPFRIAHRILLPILGRRAASITTVSELSRGHLVRFGIASREKIEVTYNGSDHATRWNASRSNLVDPPVRPFVLCIGRDQKYKNIELLLHLAGDLDRVGLDIWMAGDVDRETVLRHVAAIPQNLHLLGHIGDDDFKAALSQALCFLFPSRIEGFGLPAIEAMASGCPVIASTSPCLPEICGDAALYADPETPREWLERILQLKEDPSERVRLIEAGRAKAATYSWRGIAETYLKLMADADT